MLDRSLYGNRTIFHIDVNSAFLSWQAVTLLEGGHSQDIRLVPSLVGGDEASRRGIVLASSLPAKQLGIRTGEPLFQARRKCPQVLIYPPDYDMFLRRSQQLVRFLYQFSPLVEPFSIDECFLDYTGCQGLFGSPEEGAQRIRQGIRQELGFTVNVGVGPNKLLAKMASDFEKPDRVHTLWPEEIAEKMWPLPVRELFMVGHASAKRLQGMGIRTIGQLAATSCSILESHFGRHGRLMWQYANGLDATRVSSSHPRMKEISNSTTTPQDLYTLEEVSKTLLALCQNVSSRLRKQRRVATLATITLRRNDFSTLSRQCRIPASDCSRTLFHHCLRLLEQLWDGSPLRHMGVSFGGLLDASTWQPSLLEDEDEQRLRQLDRAMDSIHSQYGDTSLCPASVLDVPYLKSKSRRFHEKAITRMGGKDSQ
ncbi:MAG: DNA polymerase Y family protein [Eubacteriales bacterium]|jgi:DNA polymerase-4